MAPKPPSKQSPAPARRHSNKQPSPIPNFYNGPTEVVIKKGKTAASGTPVAVSSVVQPASRISSRRRSSPFKTWLWRILLSYTLLSLLFCPPQLSPSVPAICRPASSYHQTLQPYIQPHINSAIASSKAHIGPYYEPYRPQIEAVGSRLHDFATRSFERAAPFVSAGQSTVVRNYKQHLAPRVHYAKVRLSALVKPYVNNVVVRYKVLVRPYVVRAQKAVAHLLSTVLAHPWTGIAQAKASEIGRISKSGARIAYGKAQPGLTRLSIVGRKYLSCASVSGKKYSTIAVSQVSSFSQEKVVPFVIKKFKDGKALGHTGGQRVAREVKLFNDNVLQPKLVAAHSAFNDKVYTPYLAEYLEPLYQPAKLIAKTSVHEAVKLGRPVIHYIKLAVQLAARYAKLVHVQVVSPAVSRAAGTFNQCVYGPYLAQHLDPVVKPTGAFVSSLSLHAQRAGSPVVEHLIKLSLPVWQRFFPAPEPVKEATLLEKVMETVELAREKVEDVFVGGAQSTEDSQPKEDFEEGEEENVEDELAEEEEEELVKSDDAKVVDEGVDVDISTEETEIEDLLPTPELMPVVPVLATEEDDAYLAEEITSSDPESQPELLEEQIDEEEFSTDEEDEDYEDEDAEFLASLEASDDPALIAVPDITEPELPDLPAVDDTPAELSEKEVLKKAAVAEMRAEIEKKQHDFEEKLARVGDIEERKLIDKLVDIRSRAKALFPQISEHWIASVEKDALKASKSIEKYFKRSNLRREDVESAILKGRARVGGKVDDAADSVNHWLAEIEAREEKAVQEAADQVDMVASEAVNVLGLAYAWLDDVTRHDWTRYHGITKAGEGWHDKYTHHATSDDSHPALSTPETDMDGLVDLVRLELEEIQDGFSAKVGILKTNAMLKIDKEERKAQGLPEEDPHAPMVSIQPIWDAIGGGAAAAVGAGIIGKGRDQVLDALSQAGEVVTGFVEEEPTETGYLAQASSSAVALVDAASEILIATTTTTSTVFVDQVTQVVESVYEQASSEAVSLGEDASSLLHSATRSAASAIGITPSPDSPSEYLESFLAAISEPVESVVEAASETLHEATRAASRAVGATPTPESTSETVEQVVEDVKSLAVEGFERVQGALHWQGEL